MDHGCKISSHGTPGGDPVLLKEVEREKFLRLRRLLEEIGQGLIAVSGGVDSRFLAKVAGDVPGRFVLLHFSGPHYLPSETAFALKWLEAGKMAFKTEVIDPLLTFKERPMDELRCYHCKERLFRRAGEIAEAMELPAVLDGTQSDDLQEYRPGIKALKELGVLSPLADTGLGKKEIRRISRTLDLSFWNQPSRPCLLTRFPYGRRVNPADLQLVAEVEEYCLTAGFRDFRFRLHPEGRWVLFLSEREEIRLEQVRSELEKTLGNLGVQTWDIRFTSTLSGYFDREGNPHGR